MEAIVLQYGLAGVCVIALSGVARQLYIDNKELNRQVGVISQARIDDIKELKKAEIELMQEMSLNIKLIQSKIEAGKQGN